MNMTMQSTQDQLGEGDLYLNAIGMGDSFLTLPLKSEPQIAFKPFDTVYMKKKEISLIYAQFV